MSELPSGWTEAEIGELCDLINGRAFKPTDWTESGLPIVRIQNLNNPNKPFNRFDGEVRERFLIDSGDLLFAWSGTPGTSFGAHVWTGGPAVLNQHIFNVRFDRESLDREFFRHAINQKLNELIDKAHGGVGLRHVTKGKFEETKVSLPPLPEQRRIVRKLDTLSARTTTARTHLTAIAKLVERYRTSVLEQEFFGAHSEGWEKVSFLQTVESTQNGLSKRRGDDGQPCKVLRLADLSGNVFIGDAPREIVLTDKEQQKFALTSGDIAIVRVNGSEKIVGRMIVWGEEEGWTYCDHFIRARLSDEFDPSFVRWLFETDTVRAQIEASFVSSAGQKTINKTILSQIMVPDISMEEQREIVRRIEAAFAKIDRLAAEAEKALKLTDRLDQRILAKAFAGELVPQDPTDEPATELLARIREARATAPKPKRGRRKKAEA